MNSSRPVTRLEPKERRRVFWEGPKFFKLCLVVLNYLQHIFLGERTFFQGEYAPPLVSGLNSSMPNNEWSSLKSECQCSEKLVMVKRDHQACKLRISAQECCLGTWKWVASFAYCSLHRFFLALGLQISAQDSWLGQSRGVPRGENGSTAPGGRMKRVE